MQRITSEPPKPPPSRFCISAAALALIDRLLQRDATTRLGSVTRTRTPTPTLVLTLILTLNLTLSITLSLALPLGADWRGRPQVAPFLHR